MATGIVAAAIMDTLSGVSVVDQSSVVNYLPAVQTQNTCLIIPPMRHQAVYGWRTLGAGATPQWESPRYFCEFWVKHRGSDSDLVTRVRTVLDEVPGLLMADQTLAGTVTAIGWTEDGDSIDVRVRTSVDGELLLVGDARYLRVTVEVPVIVTL